MAMNNMRAGSFLLSAKCLASREPSAAHSEAGEPIMTRSMLAPAIYYVHFVQRIKIAYLQSVHVILLSDLLAWLKKPK